VPAKRFLQVVAELPDGEVAVSATDDKAVVSAGAYKSEFPGIDREDFPQLPDADSKDSFSIPATVLQRLFSKTEFAASRDETRPSLNGVYWQVSQREMRMVATDGHRLAKIELTGDTPKAKIEGAIVPPKALAQVVKLSNEDDEIEISVTDSFAVFRAGDNRVTARLIEGPYPNYEQVIPKDNDKTLRVGRDALTAAVRRALVLANQMTYQIKFSIREGKVEVSTTNPDTGSKSAETLNVEYDGERLDVGFNASYILDVLKHVDGDTVEFLLSTPISASLVKSSESVENESYLCLVMPLRLVD
jgi:DNA polymerase-3 subunit beta